MIVPVILSGGDGIRLWPLSRKLYPKQFHSLINDNSLLQDTITRLPNSLTDPVIICNEAHRFIVAEQLREIHQKNKGIILEPEGKNTAPAVAIAALRFLNKGEDPLLLVLSADHLITNDIEFHSAIQIASKIAEKGKLAALGVKPNQPITGYGYIEVDHANKCQFYEILSFKEKPSLNVAKEYLKSGSYFWNSGIFIFKASTYLNELEKFETKIFNACQKACLDMTIDYDFIRLNNDEFMKCPSKSIDYAVMEKTTAGVVIPFEGGWSDIGSWDSLWTSKTKDENMNVYNQEVVLNEVNNSFIRSNNRLIVVNDVSDLVIIDTDDALLVSSKENSQNIRLIVKKLKDENRIETEHHRLVYRPWGYFDLIESREGFQVKRIFVNSGSKLSLQKHLHRAEHWVVIKGIARVTCGEEIFELSENQSTYIPKGFVHRLENQHESTLEIIEIQTGEYLDEDDIIRLEDDYKRN